MNRLIPLFERPRLLTLIAGVCLALAACDDDDEPIGPAGFPDVRGSWIGQYSVFSCTLIEVGDPFFCDELFYEGASLVFELDLDQAGSRVSGFAFQGQVAGEVGGTIDELGLLELSGQIGIGENSTTIITDWATELVGDSLVGQWNFEISDNSGSGFASAVVDADILLVDPRVLTFFNCPVEFTLRIGDAVDGLLAPGDCALDDLSFFDVFALNVEPGDDVLITMESEDFSPFLWVTDVDEAPLAVDGEEGRSVAAITGSSGQRETWLIVANSYAADVTGSYQLFIDRNAPGTTSAPLSPLSSTRVSASVVKGGSDSESQSSMREAIKHSLTRIVGTRGR